jgi:uncharacterized delta-60 repeat protein
MSASISSLVATVLAVLAMTATAWAAPGDLDPSFGDGGHVVVQANVGCQRRGCVEFGGSYAEAVAVQPDGGIVIGGYDSYIGAPVPRSGEPPAGALVRLLPNGALDTSFGAEGIVDTPFKVEQINTNSIDGLAVMGSVGANRLGVARYTSAGVLDGSFAPQGVRWISHQPGWQEERRDAQGRIVVLAALTANSIGVVRYLSSGALDLAFGRNGYAGVLVPETRREAATPPGSLYPPQVTTMAFATEPDGGVLVAFAVASYEPSGSSQYGTPRYFLERLTPSGRLDRSFGKNGVVRLLGEVSKIAVAPNGHILLASAEPTEGALRLRRTGSRRLLLTNYTPKGRLDRAFGENGVARSQPIISVSQVGVAPRAIGFDAEGDPIVVGELPKRTIDVPNGTGFLARYTAQGLDCSFGTHGLIIDNNDIGGASAVAVQPDGRIVVAGWSRKAFMAARYMGGGIPHTCPNDTTKRKVPRPKSRS